MSTALGLLLVALWLRYIIWPWLFPVRESCRPEDLAPEVREHYKNQPWMLANNSAATLTRWFEDHKKQEDEDAILASYRAFLSEFIASREIRLTLLDGHQITGAGDPLLGAGELYLLCEVEHAGLAIRRDYFWEVGDDKVVNGWVTPTEKDRAEILLGVMSQIVCEAYAAEKGETFIRENVQKSIMHKAGICLDPQIDVYQESRRNLKSLVTKEDYEKLVALAAPLERLPYPMIRY